MKLLLIEDEKDLAESIVQYLSSHQFVCEWVSSIFLALDKIVTFDYDCVLLDLMLKDGNGFSVLNELKRLHKTEGIIIISAKDGIDTKVEGLQMGADDYLIKPFHLSELLARIQALLRRKNFNGNNILEVDGITIDLLAKTVEVDKKQVTVTRTEFHLLLYLVNNRNRVLSKSAIAEHLSGDMANMLISHDFVYSHIKNLKKKLQDAGVGNFIRTAYGLGYKWQA